MTVSRALVIGAGSVGKRHISICTSIFDEIWVVDIDEMKEIEVANLLHSAHVTFHFYRSVKELPRETLFDLVIISNWGPDHFETFLSVKMKSKRFLIEKPLVSRLRDLDDMKTILEKENLTVVTNLQWNYSGFREQLQALVESFRLGRPLDIQILGGAKCIVTNGIHYLALTSQIFGEYPESVTASLSESRINPRGEQFFYVGGVSTWRYSDNRFLSVHFQNNSNTSAVMRILFRNSVIEVVGSRMSLRTIPISEMMNIQKPIHTRDVSELLWSGDAFLWPDGKDGLYHLMEKLLSDKIKEDFEFGYQATLGIIGALISSREERGINFRLLENNKINKEYRDFEWRIT